MTIKSLLAAVGMLAATVGLAGTADAQRHDRGRDRYDQRGPGYHGDRHDRGRHYGRDRRWERGRHHDCRIVYRHHRRVRICR